MGFLVGAAAIGAASVLLWAGIEKARAPGSTRLALVRLGLPESASGSATGLLAAVELALALGLVFAPGSAWTIGGVALLSGAFAVAGLIALSHDEPIRCGCFGPAGTRRLGRDQLLALPIGLGVAALLALEDPAPLSLPDGVARLTLIALGLATARGLAVARAWSQARGDRRSAQEMYVWLR